MRRPGFLFVLLLLGACAPPVPQNRMPAPKLDASQPFTFEVAVPAVADSPESSRSSYLDEMTAGSGTDDGGEASVPRATRNVGLVGVLMGSLPDSWDCSTQGDVTLMTHSGPGGAPDALIYVQRYSDRAVTRPTAEVNHFYQAVDPSLSSGWLRMFEAVEAQTVQLATTVAMPHWQVVDALGLLLSPTLGRGLGYEAQQGTFSGWKWLGRNERGVFLRLSRSHGTWGPQGDLPEHVRRVLEELSAGSVELANLLWEPELATMPPSTPAFEVLGSASLHFDRGVHLAILCRQSPDCPVQDDLIRFIGELRVSEPGLDVECQPDLVDSALQAGLRLMPDAAEELQPVLAQAMAVLATDSLGGSGIEPGATEPTSVEGTVDDEK